MSASILIDPAQQAREDIARKANLEADQAKAKVDNLEADLEGSARVPEKFKSKTREEIAEAYTNLEKELSRKNNELHQVRQTVDQIVPLERQSKEEKELAPITSDDLFQDPEKAITQTIENNPRIQELNSKADAIERSIGMSDFTRRHPTYQQDLQNTEFQEWVKASPVRIRLAVAADQYNFQAADDLWHLWDEFSSIRKDAKVTQKLVEQEERQQRERDGTLEGGTGNSTEAKKILSRNEIIDLKKRAMQGDRKAQSIVEDPAWRAEVQLAYLEKRVQ